MKTVVTIFGTRPDTIKMAPVVLELGKHKNEFRTFTIATAQHRHMLDQVLHVFRIIPDLDMDVMLPRQSLAQITSNIMSKLDAAFVEAKPDLVLVQGDTTTTFIGSLTAFYHKIPVGHLEAGLRTNDKYNPFPEEINRRLTTAVTDLHFAPTLTAKRALLAEHVSEKSIFVTGNTVIDALLMAVESGFSFDDVKLKELVEKKRNNKTRIVLITMHRRENWGEPMLNICEAIRTLAVKYRDVNFVFPVHLNPTVRDVVFPVLKNLANVHLMEPLTYKPFVNMMYWCDIILTDSGGVQEEAPSLGKPVLVMRKVTERPEAVKAGTVKLVGMEKKRIIAEASRLLEDNDAYRAMASAVNPYGDGKAAWRTVEALRYYFRLRRTRPAPFKATR